ncbi:hypothetical protein TK78_24510 [Streptomyces sp. Tue 6075]|uniref:hypothetical protein n=1 Tax=Streptomyces sp. Tue 6075 TaxID=1661694 RepID=UPI00094A438E|nr:hypothetical protein [Streptomyces sp. Tue 6075]APS21730.1 hypothetical protein TK78_24510 [Streptomyces sp. Tue 6075]
MADSDEPTEPTVRAGGQPPEADTADGRLQADGGHGGPTGELRNDPDRQTHSTAYRVALISGAAAILAAMTTGSFGLLADGSGGGPSAARPSTVVSATASAAGSLPVSDDGAVAPPLTPSPTPSASSGSGTGSAPATGERDLTLGAQGCGSTTIWVDLDAQRPARTLTRRPDMTPEELNAFEFTYDGCGSGEIEVTVDRPAGWVARDQDVDEAGCREAAESGSLSEITGFGDSSLSSKGITPGGSLCFVTDQNKVVRALLRDIGKEQFVPSLHFRMTTWS